ncbi:MAG: ribonuclease PH [SAR202 cluster bacterium]|nr:ribonuclease PH [Chloroflexota bacterium]MQG22377.1 ribonuclease PH [SAR202 cluster bacterium]
MRIDQRKNNQLREIKIEVSPMEFSNGSVILSTGKTKVLCSASIEEGVPKFLSGSNQGWLTAEYSMLPGSTNPRTNRNNNKKGRSQEIQRLIGRSLRASIDFTKLGENTVVIDCDVLQADGGTRTASITGGYIALHMAVLNSLNENLLKENPLVNKIAATSIGLIGNEILLDLCYKEDSEAGADFNLVMADNGNIIEIQGAAEKQNFDIDTVNKVLEIGSLGIKKIFEIQNKIISEL